MRFFLKKLVIFSALFIAIYCVLIVTLGTCNFLDNTILFQTPPTGDYLLTRLQEVQEYGEVDVLFLGSSHTYRGFDPSNFPHTRSFNLGSSAQTHIQTNILVKRYYGELQPKLVVYEVYPDLFSNDGVESALMLVSLGRLDRHVIGMNLVVRDIRLLNTSLFRILTRNLNTQQAYNEPSETSEQRYVSGGYVERQILKYKSIEIFTPFHIYFDKKQLRAFENTINFFEQNNTAVLLVFAPITRSRYSRYTNLEEFSTQMSSYADFYDFNKILSLSDSNHFYDSHHLNQNGVDIFNNTLFDYIIEYLE